MRYEPLCASEALQEGHSLRASFSDDDHGHGLCLIRLKGQVYGYLNRCPHQQMAMDWMPGQFLDAQATHIVCAMHGAQFRVTDGLCLAGPCQGLRLQAVALQERDGQIFLQQQIVD